MKDMHLVKVWNFFLMFGGHFLVGQSNAVGILRAGSEIIWAAETAHMPMPDNLGVGTEEILLRLKIKVKLCSQNLERETQLRLLDKFKRYSDLQGIITEHEFITLL